MTNPPRPPDDEPRSQPFQPVSYDLAPEYGTPPPANNPPYASDQQAGYPAAPASGPSGYPPSSGYPAAPASGPAGYPASGAFPASGAGGYGAGPGPGYGAQQPDPYGPPQSYPQQPPSPAYPTTGYPQPAYQAPQPTYPGPGYTPTPPVPPKKGKGLKITLSVIGGVFLLCAIAACVFLYPVFSESGAHVTAPPTLPGNLTKDDSAEMQKLVDGMESDLRNDVGSVDEIAAGIYSDGDPEKLVILVAATSTILFPDTEIEDAFKGFNQTSGAGLTTGSQKDYDAGKLGGTLKCATGTSDEVKMTLCAWADHGSVGIGVFVNRESDESAALFVQIRDAVQTR